MADQLVGGAFLNAFLNVLFDRMATPEFLDLFRTGKLDRILLQKLKTYLKTIYAVLYDAEFKQIACQDTFVKDFLNDLKDAAYEADDLLDLIAYEVTAAEFQAHRRATAGNRLWNLSSLHNLVIKKANMNHHSKKVIIPRDVTKRIEEIVKVLEILVQQIDPLGLKKSDRKEALPQREPTSHVVEESDIIGRKNEKDAILKLLEAADKNVIGVIPIVGMGGIGKTTLAQFVYNDSKVKELFATKAWVCVSDIYDGFRIKKELLLQVNTSVKFDELTPQKIDEKLKESLANRKYLIVLDDIWENAYHNWDRLQVPLKSGARGSKIIFTTRNDNIASMMSTVGAHRLSTLTADSCWQLFAKHAFINGEGDQSLQSFRKDVLSKCGGLPLAAKMLGGVMRGKQEKAEWDAILKTKIWELDCGVKPVLMLSYQYLPSHLKQCFAYCAIFPKNYKIRKEEIIQLWMAECFLVKPKGGGGSIDELGEKCLQELGSRSFFQEHNDKKEGSYFLMHDLINDLAHYISEEFLSRMDEDNICEFSTRNRYFSFMVSEANRSVILSNIHKVKFLRSFLSISCNDVDREVRKLIDKEQKKIHDEIIKRHRYYWSKENSPIMHNDSISEVPLKCIFMSLCCVYILFEVCTFWCSDWMYGLDKELKKIVDEVVNDLRCLRVLSLRNFPIVKLSNSIKHLKHLRYLNLERTNVKRLPKTVCSLYNLQTLILYQCFQLVELPKSIGNLINLHFLDIRETNNLKKMPRGMGNLKDLRNLSKFLVGKQKGVDIDELAKLQHLRGELHISNLQNVVCTPNDILKNKKHLEDLTLEWSTEKTKDLEYEERVLEGLQPYTSINKLSISGYGGRKLADWIGDSSYINIVSLKLNGFKSCTFLPAFDKLTSLKHLSISQCNVVAKVFMTEPLCCLKTLLIQNMGQWEEWFFCEENASAKRASLPKLEKLTIKNCPKLNTISTCGPTHMIFCSLNSLIVEGCPDLKISKLVAISNFKQLAKKSKPPNRSLISELKTYDHNNNPKVALEQLSSAMYSLYVEKLTAEGIEEMGIALNALEDVTIKESDLRVPLEVFPGLRSFYVEKCHKLESFLHALTFLASLKISYCDSFICFPRGGITAPNLRHLEILECPHLKSLPEGMHVLLPSLEDLKIEWCKELESFPEGGLPANLQSLEIKYCNKLIGGCWQLDLQSLHALSLLYLAGYDGGNVDCFPFPSALTSLEMSLFENLKFMNCKDLQHLTHLKISSCDNLQCFIQEGLSSSPSALGGGLLPNLRSLEIERCNKLIGGRLQWGLQRFKTLKHLHLREYWKDDLGTFPEESLLPSTLTSLTIEKFINLEVINYKGLQHLTSLAQLEIRNCYKLRCLPEGLPSSLSVLRIARCHLLKERCERGKGKDWPNISHISTIEIDYKKI